MSIQAYPLAWPAGWRRTPAAELERARFSRKEWHPSSHPDGHGWNRSRSLTIADGVDRILDALEKFGAETVVISTNARTRSDGLPRSTAREPDDAGAAVYWTLDGQAECMAIDRYTRLGDNLAAIAATIEAMRAIERHGGAEILKRVFTGFKALPETAGTTMGIAAAWGTVERLAGTSIYGRTADAARDYVRSARNKTHPDKGGRPGDFQLVQRAAETLGAHFGVKL